MCPGLKTEDEEVGEPKEKDGLEKAGIRESLSNPGLVLGQWSSTSVNIKIA